jgi:hypothetical protein
MQMKAKRCVAVLAVSATLILALWAVVRAADKAEGDRSQLEYAEKQGETLRGAQGVYVLVRQLKPEIEQLGLTRAALRIDTELQLRQYGIKVLTSEEWLKTPNAPDLCINVNVMPLNEDPIPFLAASIEVRFDQQVWLVRDSTMRCSAATWHANAAWRVPRARLASVRDVVKDNVAKFINDYLAVNPKQPTPK